MVQIGEGLLAVNRLPPYNSWEDYLPTVQAALAVYQEVAAPAGYERIGLRYINRVRLSAGAAIADSFAFHPELPEQPDGTLRGFVAGAQWAFDNERDALRVQLGEELSGEGGTRQYLLDLDYVLTQPDAIPLSDYAVWLGTAHDRVQAGFEAAITDAAREVFGVRRDPID